jgi:hypothetical protein
MLLLLLRPLGVLISAALISATSDATPDLVQRPDIRLPAAPDFRLLTSASSSDAAPDFCFYVRVRPDFRLPPH